MKASEGYIVVLWDKEKGEVRRINQDGSPSFYSWEDGNERCDCNRYRYFYNYEGEHPCGKDRFHLLCIEWNDKFYYTDEDGDFINRSIFDKAQ